MLQRFDAERVVDLILPAVECSARMAFLQRDMLESLRKHNAAHRLRNDDATTNDSMRTHHGYHGWHGWH